MLGHVLFCRDGDGAGPYPVLCGSSSLCIVVSKCCGKLVGVVVGIGVVDGVVFGEDVGYGVVVG